MKKLHELINLDEPAWAMIHEWMSNATNHYEILPRDISRAETELLRIQVTTRSPMGAVIFETGGILVDYGWVRVLGSGCQQLDRGLAEWNQYATIAMKQPGFLLVADDVVGGYFAICSEGMKNQIGKIHYLAPDTLVWENLECGYSDFLYWLLHGDIAKFYQLFRWQNWQDDVKHLDGNQTFSFYPFLWTKYESFEGLNRKAISIQEHLAFTIDMQNQLSEMQ